MSYRKLLDFVARVARPCTWCSKDVLREIARVVDSIVTILQSKVEACILTSPTSPVMMTYLCDGWTAKIESREKISHEEHITVNKRGRYRHEFDLQRAFIRQKRACGKDRLLMLVAKPRGLSRGRKATDFFRIGCRASWPSNNWPFTKSVSTSVAIA